MHELSNIYAIDGATIKSITPPYLLHVIDSRFLCPELDFAQTRSAFQIVWQVPL